MDKKDIRWEQRLVNFNRALAKLEEINEQLKGAEAQKSMLFEAAKEGLIQRFEFTHELAWNLLKDYLEYQGIVGISGPRDATRQAFERGIISDGETWMDMIRSRNITSHTYNEATANKIYLKIGNRYLPLFQKLGVKLLAIKNSLES